MQATTRKKIYRVYYHKRIEELHIIHETNTFLTTETSHGYKAVHDKRRPSEMERLHRTKKAALLQIRTNKITRLKERIKELLEEQIDIAKRLKKHRKELARLDK